MRKYDISSKEAYLNWVAEWKAEYKALTEEIRAVKVELAKPHTPFSRIKQSEKIRLKRNAFRMIEQRQTAKEESWKAKQAAVTKI